MQQALNMPADILIGSAFLLISLGLWFLFRRRVRAYRQEYLELVNTVDGIVWEAQVGKPRYTFVSKQAEGVLGYPIERWVNENGFWQSILHAEDRARMTGEKYVHANSKQDSQIEYRVLTADGRTLWVKDYIKVIYENGKPTTMRGIMVDITERKEAETELKLAQETAEAALGAKAEFLANVSHEIRTPLNAIIGMTTVVLDTDMSEDQKDCLSTIKTSADSLLMLINDILDFSKIDANKVELEPSDFKLSTLCQNVTEVMSPLARVKGVTLESKHFAKTLDDFRGDSGRLMQILMNLMSNAVKFTGSQGHVSLTTRQIPQESTDEILLRFEISDTGIGIPEEVKQRLFQPFIQADSSTARKYGGTGLGLTLCKRLVELMKGKIGFDSVQGKGSVFWFQIPLVKATAPVTTFEVGPDSQQSKEVRKNVRILVADDNPANQKVILRFLEKLQYSGEVVANGEEAVTSFQRGFFDLILMDCQMSEMDGYEATRRIRMIEKNKGTAHIPIIALTANALSGDRKKCNESGMDDYLSKPVSIQQLDTTLSFWLSKARRKSEQKSPVRARPVSVGNINFKYLQSLEILRVEGKPDILIELFEYFQSSGKEKVTQMVTAQQNSKFEELSRLAHSFKSTCHNVGASKLASILQRIEDRPDESVDKDVARLESEYSIVCRELSAFLARRRRSVLIVEDNEDIRESLKSALNMFGLRAFGASNGKEAMEVLLKMDTPCLILLDLMLPVMNGWEFRKMQKANPKVSDVPVVVFSADGQLNQKAAQIGAVACLKKPVDLEELISTAKRYSA